MPEQVTECPYCHGTFPHQGPTGCPPIKWPPDPKPRWRVTEWDSPSEAEFVYEVESLKTGWSVFVRRFATGPWAFVDPFSRPLPSEIEREEIKEVVRRYALEHQHFFATPRDPFDLGAENVDVLNRFGEGGE